MDPPQMAESSGRFNVSLSGSVNQESLQSLLVRQPQLQTFSCYRFPFATLLHIILTVDLLNVQTGLWLKSFFLTLLKKTIHVFFSCSVAPLTCMPLRSAPPRTRLRIGHILSGRAPDGVAPPACAPPPGSERPEPLTRSSGRDSCCSWPLTWPRCSRRRTTPWASC